MEIANNGWKRGYWVCEEVYECGRLKFIGGLTVEMAFFYHKGGIFHSVSCHLSDLIIVFRNSIIKRQFRCFITMTTWYLIQFIRVFYDKVI